jgi:hypothetical protein
MGSLLNKSAVRKFIMERWKRLRPGHEMTCVSAEALTWAESRLRNEIDAMINRHPSVGKTIRPD